MTSTRIIVHGASGRMGREVLALVDASPDLLLIGSLPGAWPEQVEADMVLVDFSLPAALPKLFEYCRSKCLPLVSGTTGLDSEQLAMLHQLGTEIPVLWAPNFSLGVAVLRRAITLAAASLPLHWDVSLVDVHHRHKRDSPSGTARLLAEGVDQTRQGRSGTTGAQASPVQVLSARVGEVIGDHQLVFAGPSERLEFGHRADRRSLFAEGALHAARWLRTQQPGLYTLDDCLG